MYKIVVFKLRPHHNLAAVKEKFIDVKTLEVSRTAVEGARALGYSLVDIVNVVKALLPSHFIKSETAHSPPNSKIWHDTNKMSWNGRKLYLKFAGETLIDVRLTSFKEINDD